MSKHKIRHSKTCLNCGHYVEKNYCPNCGQENVSLHLPFHDLVKHFVEDLVHYDSSFWKTVKYLLIAPNELTKEYLSGKRKTYVEPIKLYIFISFIVFFIPHILPDFSAKDDNKIKQEGISNIDINISSDSINSSFFKYKNIGELDSVQHSLPEDKKMSFLEYYFLKKCIKNNVILNKELTTKVAEALLHNLPKVLFVYLPLFAFILWLFHNKRKWLFFDSAIFTLHYFSFLLLLITIYEIISSITTIQNVPILSYISTLNNWALIIYPPVYFIIAQKRMYNESIRKSLVKSIIFGFINIFLILFILITYTILTLVMVLD